MWDGARARPLFALLCVVMCVSKFEYCLVSLITMIKALTVSEKNVVNSLLIDISR